MAVILKRDAPTVWLLVKVPQIIHDGSGADHTEKRLRDTIRDHHFGGEKAAVRKLTVREKMALEDAHATRPRKSKTLA